MSGADDGPPLNAVRWDPEIDRWTPLPMRLPRMDPAIVELAGGIWVVGGRVGYTEVDSVEGFGAEGCIPEGPSLLRHHSAHVALQDGSVLALGGVLHGKPTRTVERRTATRWTTAGTLVHRHREPVAVARADGTVVVVGDRVAEVFDPRTQAATDLPTPIPVSRPVLVPTGDGTHVLLGRGDSYEPVALLLDGDAWFVLPTPPTNPELATVLADGRLLMGQGERAWAGPPEGPWQPQQTLYPLRRYDTLDLLADGRVLHVGSRGVGVLETDGTWTDLGTKHARFKHSVVPHPDGGATVFGGVVPLSLETMQPVTAGADDGIAVFSLGPGARSLTDASIPRLTRWFGGRVLPFGDYWLAVGGKHDPGADGAVLEAMLFPRR